MFSLFDLPLYSFTSVGVNRSGLDCKVQGVCKCAVLFCCCGSEVMSGYAHLLTLKFSRCQVYFGNDLLNNRFDVGKLHCSNYSDCFVTVTVTVKYLEGWKWYCCCGCFYSLGQFFA